MPQPRLIATSVPRRPRAAVLVLHGGANRPGNPMVSPTQLSVLRMVPVARRLARSARRELAVFRVLNSTRGWDASHTPVDDARWAMDEVRDRLGDLPLGLVGHSLGGRAALLAAGRDEVRSIVALNPWVYPQDGDVSLPGRRVAIVHGSADRIASPARALEAARRLSLTAQVSFVQVAGGKHAMLARHRTFDALAADFTAGVLLGRPARGAASRALAGEPTLEV